MVKKISNRSRVTETHATIKQIIGAYKNTSLSSDNFLNEILTNLETLESKLNVAIMRSETQSVLEEKDEVCDQALRNLFALVSGYTHHPDAQIKEAAILVDNIIEHYGFSIIKESYATQTSLTNSLINDLEAADKQEAIAKLSGCAEVLELVKTAVTDFEQTRVAYEEAKASESTYESASKIKTEVVKLINDKLVVYLRAMQQVNEAEYGSFARTVNEIIETNNEAVKRRSNHKEEVE